METWDTICARRNVRTYRDTPVRTADLDRILEAGRRAPSASNRQPWDFVVTTDRSTMEALSTLWRGGRHLASAAAVVVLTLREPTEERYRTLDQFDLGQAAMAMQLAAVDRGIGSGHSAVGDQEAARRILSIPDEWICAYMLAFGYPADRLLAPIRRPNRRPLEEVVHRGRW